MQFIQFKFNSIHRFVKFVRENKNKSSSTFIQEVKTSFVTRRMLNIPKSCNSILQSQSESFKEKSLQSQLMKPKVSRNKRCLCWRKISRYEICYVSHSISLPTVIKQSVKGHMKEESKTATEHFQNQREMQSNVRI